MDALCTSGTPKRAPSAPDRGWVGLGWRHPHYQAVLTEQPGLAFLEVHSENFFGAGGAALEVLTQARSHYPISLHGVGLSLGSAVGLDTWHLDQLAALVRHIDPVRVSDHASFARGQLASGAVVHAADLLPLPFTTEALDVLCANVQQVQDRLQRRFVVENISSYLGYPAQLGEPAWTEPDFLSALAQRTGCALLVDVNNLYVNALNAQINGTPSDPVQHCRHWLDAIAPADVAEIHLAGHSHVAPDPHDPSDRGLVIDDHGSRVCAEVWQIYQHALHRFGPVPTLVEWDTDLPPLAVLLDEVALAQALVSAHESTAT